MSTIECNVVILPSDQLATKAIATSLQLSKQGTLFNLELGRFYPHVSLYMLNLKSDDIETVKASLAQIANTSSTLELVAVEYSQSRGYFDASYEKTAPLSDLQQRVVDTLNPLRDGMRKNDIARLSEATGKMLENYQKYGWNSIGELYRPHLTLARFISEETKPENLPVFTEFSGLYNRLGIFEMGDNGTCVRELGSWDLV